MSKRGSGFAPLMRQGARVAAAATLLWCLYADMSLLETLIRIAIVYFVLTIIGYAASAQLARLTVPPTSAGEAIDAEVIDPADPHSPEARS